MRILYHLKRSFGPKHLLGLKALVLTPFFTQNMSMKKWLSLCLICFFISPTFAQRRGLTNFFHSAKKPGHTEIRTKVKHKTHRASATHPSVAVSKKSQQKTSATSHQSEPKHVQNTVPSSTGGLQPTHWQGLKNNSTFSMNTQVQIVNLPGQPAVHLQPQIPAESAVVSARMVNGEEFMSVVFPGGLETNQMFIPSNLSSPSPVGYRGIPLNDIGELRNILENGLEAQLSADGKMFFSGQLRTSLLFSKHVKEKIPMIVQFRVPEDMLLYKYSYDYFVMQDIPPSHFNHVMIFLEVNGKPGWYRVTLENGDLVFTEQTGQIFHNSELIEHEFDVPFERQEWW